MCHHPRIIWAAVFISCLAFGGPASARIQFTLSVDQLLDDADIVVRARPIDAENFVVEEVLRGDFHLESERIRINSSDYDCRIMQQAGEQRVVREVLLFLRHPEEPCDFDYEPVMSGIRYLLAADGSVLVPFERVFQSWGFRADERTDWIALLAQLRDILARERTMNGVWSTPARDCNWVELCPSGPHEFLNLRISQSSP